jgi:type II secretory pathway pseudopilin PulG
MTRVAAMHRTSRSRDRSAFTLLETALAMVIVMVGVVAIVEAQRGFMQANGWSSQEATASYLANELRERIRLLPRHDPVTGLSIQNNVLVGLGREANEVTVNDLDDVDDYGGLTFGAGGNFDGPIDAFGRVIQEIDENGLVRVDGGGNPIALRGWTQSVAVEKVDPFNFSSAAPWTATQSANGVARAVDQFPLRVTVTVSYQGPLDPAPTPVTQVSWIVPR